jgi:hypothetical protein
MGGNIFNCQNTSNFFAGVYVEKFYCMREISRQGREVAVIQTTMYMGSKARSGMV